MVPVFLVTLAYEISLDNPRVDAPARIKAALELSAAGLMMIRGQVHDMRQDRDGVAGEEQRLVQCYRLKSAALYGAGAMMGGILTGADDDESSSPQAAGVDLGLSYNSSTMLPMLSPAWRRSARSRAWMRESAPPSMCSASTARGGRA